MESNTKDSWTVERARGFLACYKTSPATLSVDPMAVFRELAHRILRIGKAGAGDHLLLRATRAAGYRRNREWIDRFASILISHFTASSHTCHPPLRVLAWVTLQQSIISILSLSSQGCNCPRLTKGRPELLISEQANHD